METLITELDYLQAIYNLLYKFTPLINLMIGFIQLLIIIFVLVVLYKLFNLFF